MGTSCSHFAYRFHAIPITNPLISLYTAVAERIKPCMQHAHRSETLPFDHIIPQPSLALGRPLAQTYSYSYTPIAYTKSTPPSLSPPCKRTCVVCCITAIIPPVDRTRPINERVIEKEK